MNLPLQNLDQRFVWQLMAMVATELIDQQHYRAWADDVILNDPKLPNWVINLSMAKDSATAIDALYEHVSHKPPPEIFKLYPRDWVACQWLKYRDATISYPVFLSIAGTYADRYDVGVQSDDLDRRLNEYMAHPSKHMEAIGADWIETKFKDAIDRMKPLYEDFKQRAAAHEQDGRA
jgi:hypothetical protein